MVRIFLFTLIFSLSACKLEPIDQVNELENGLDTNGDLNLGTDMPSTSAWLTGTLSLYSVNSDDQSIMAKFSVMKNGVKVNYLGEFVFSDAADFSYFLDNKELFEVANTVPFTIKVKLLRKGSTCQGAPESDYCATVISSDAYEIEDLQAIE